MELVSSEISQDLLKSENISLLGILIKSTFASAQKNVEQTLRSEMTSQISGLKSPF